MDFSFSLSDFGLELILTLLWKPVLFKILQGLRRCLHLCATFGNASAYSKTDAAHCIGGVLASFCFIEHSTYT